MRIKSVLFGTLGFLALLFLFVHTATQAQEIQSISYKEVMQQTKNDPPGVPVKLVIPTAKIAASIEPVGLLGEQLDVPSKSENVGWYKDGFRPGEKGNAVIDGHLDDSSGEPAVFWKLGLLRPNDELYTEDGYGLKQHFRVTSIQEYTYNGVPMRTLFTKSLTANLILITCAGEYDSANQNYSNRLIVAATRID